MRTGAPRGSEDLLRGVAALSEADAAATFESRALVLAEEALRVDAASASLRQAATELQRAAGARDATDRQRALAAASAAVVDEARRSRCRRTLAGVTNGSTARRRIV